MGTYRRVIAATLILIMVGELNVLVQPILVAGNSITLLRVGFEGEGSLSVAFDVKQGSYPNVLKIALFPSISDLIDKDIFVYYDQDYPSSLVSVSSWLGVIDHLEENYRLKGYGGKLEAVNALRLREIMLQKNDSVVIIPSGVFPDTVHTKEASLVKQYLENGGTLVWVGDVFAYYSGKFGGELQNPSSENPGLQAQERILGYILSNATNLDRAGVETALSNGLCLKYSGLQAGILVDEVLKHNGLVMGKIGKNMTSVAAVPVGSGFLVIFGGKVSPARSELGEDFVASDIMNILLSGIVHSNGQFTYSIINRTDVHNQTLSIEVNDRRVSGAVFLAISDDYYSYFFYRQYIPKA